METKETIKYINDFIEEFNYKPIVLDIQNVNKQRLLDILRNRDRVNHLHEFERSIDETSYIAIENCDFQGFESLGDCYYDYAGYSVIILMEDDHGYYLGNETGKVPAKEEDNE